MSALHPRAFIAAAAAAVALLLAPSAHATSAGLFGYGPRSTSLAQSDLAFPAAATAAYTNPAASWLPGTALSLGYAHAWSRLTLDGQPAPVRNIAGTDLAFQLGRPLGKDSALGGAFAVHLPDDSLARISFRPGTEPSFVRFAPSPQRSTADLALALRHGMLSVGIGASVIVDVEGEVQFLLGQDGNGTYADGNTQVTLPYRVAPTAGAIMDFGVAALALRYRGSQAIGVDLATRADVLVSGNPLNGTTTVSVAGQSGYVPATWDLGARADIVRGLRWMTSLQLARWSAAPPSAAELSMGVQLGLTPSQREARFVRPALRDTLSPRAGLEWQPPWLDQRLSLRAGYAYSPSPVPAQTGLTSYADAPAHIAAVGSGIDLGRPWGVGLRVDGALQLWLLRTRSFDKPSEVLPFAHYQVGGHIVAGSVALEASWR